MIWRSESGLFGSLLLVLILFIVLWPALLCCDSFVGKTLKIIVCFTDVIRYLSFVYEHVSLHQQNQRADERRAGTD